MRMRGAPFVVLPIAAGAMWGSAGVFVRTLADAGMDPFTIVLSRLALGMLLVLALILVKDRSMLRIRKEDVPLMIVCALSLAGLNVLYTVSAQHATLSLAAVLISMSPVFMVIMARAAFGERITRRKSICILAAATGCVMVSGVLEGSHEASTVGIAAGLTSAFCYALFGLLSKKASSNGYTTFTTLFWSMLVATLVLLPLSDPGSMMAYACEGVPETLTLILHGAVCSFLPNLLYTTAFIRLDAGTVSILAATGEPVTAAVFGSAMYSETPSPIMIVGMILALAAMAAICRQNEKKDLADPSERDTRTPRKDRDA